MELSRKGIDTKYPRAIYATGHRSTSVSSLADLSRYKSHSHLCTPDGHPILSKRHEYITIWGFWNGPDEMLAARDEVVYEGVDALTAYRDGRLTQQEYLRVMQTTKSRLAAAGIQDMNFRGDHLLLSIDRSDQLAKDQEELPLVRIRNFELLRRIPFAE